MLSLYGKLKRFFSFLFFLIVLGGFLVFYSLYEENRYQDSCKELGLKCPEGRMHKFLSSFQKIIEEKGKI